MEADISRSLHTQTLAKRAARRLLRPHSLRRSEAALLCGRGVVCRAGAESANLSDNHGVLPRVRAHRPLPGFQLPCRPADIRRLFMLLGPSAAYGLRDVRLRQECLFTSQSVTFAEYILPGIINIYAVPTGAWRLAFVPCAGDLEAFQRYAARVDVNPTARRTTVWWEPDGLAVFFLFEVLAHEIGHHVLQHHKGKRPAQVCRRADHEACADTYARRILCRPLNA